MAKRLNILKTRKLYVNGKFPRSESERYIKYITTDKEQIVNIARASRKDFRRSVKAARLAFKPWKNRTAYNRGQILYRMGEMMESRKDQIANELRLEGFDRKKAETEINSTIDLIIYFAGWADKFQQVFSRVNPVAQPFFNFSVPEPSGVVSAICSDKTPLRSAAAVLCPAILTGNAIVLLYSQKKPLTALTFAEIIHTSDVPPGVVNILTGLQEELLVQFASHMDVNAIIYCGNKKKYIKIVQQNSSLNIKRCIILNDKDLDNVKKDGPFSIARTIEIKTTWHPVGV